MIADPSALHRFVDDDGGEVVVYQDAVVFRSAASLPNDPLPNEIRISRASLVSVMNHAAKELCDPDIVVVVFRDSDGYLDHVKWSLVKKGASRTLSSAIYKIIDNGFRKSVTGFFYALTHRIV